MSWVEGHIQERELVDVNERLSQLKSDLSEATARKTLGQFLMYNLGVLVFWLTGIRLYPDQRIVIKGWLFKNFSLMVAGRGYSKCIDENSLVLTENGFKAIKETYVGEKIWANDKMQTIEAKTANPKEAGLEITTSLGFTCKGKMGHKIYCLNPETFEYEWKNIEDLTGKEIMPIRRGMGQWADKNPIRDYVYTPVTNAKQISPKHEPNLYYLMGLILGDGCLRGKRGTIKLTSADRGVQKCFIKSVKRYIDGGVYRVAPKSNPESKANDYDCYSIGFKRLLYHVGFNDKKAHEKVFPRKLMGLNQENMSAFLRGLYDTDGSMPLSYNKARNRWTGVVNLHSSSWDILKNVQSILLNYGIVASITDTHPGGPYLFSNGKTYNTNPAWTLTINNRQDIEKFHRYIGFSIPNRKKNLEKYLANTKDSIGAKGLHYNRIPIGDYFMSKYGRKPFRQRGISTIHPSVSVNRLKQIRELDFIDQIDKNKIDQILGQDYYFDSISSIKPIETTTIDIQVANEACYWSEGFINHNSFLFSHFCYLYCLFNPGKNIVMIAPTFRSSRKIIQNIEKWARAKRGFMLKQCIQTTKQGEIVSKQADLWELTFKNGSKIIALPLGDGERIRGYRCSVLGIDEGLLVSQSIIDTVLKPFLVTPSEEETTRRQTIRERETRLIRKGLLKEEDRTKFASDVKMVIISSASYTWEDLYALYTKYLKVIYSQDEKMIKKLDEKEREALSKDEEAKAEIIKGDDIPSTYLVQQLSYKVAPPDRVDAAVREEIESGMFSETIIKREYEAQFVQDSDGYFRAKVMEECTLKGANDPTIEIVGEKGAEYIVAIDPNLGGSETNDHFAICVIKIIDRKFSDNNIRKCGLVVHQYANAGAKPEHHIGYFLYILKNFNVVYVAVDTSQGSNMDFINFCNESSQFKSAKKNLQPIQYADFGKENFDDLVKDIQNGYNLSAGQIVQKQYFHSTFQKAANEYMQTCFNRRTLWFAAKGIPNESAMTNMRNQSDAVKDILDTHPDFAEDGVSGDIDDFIAHQDVLIDLVKKECALIEVKVSSLGNTTFDLPSHMKKQSKSKSRIRRDNYSALFLGNWALKLYLESKERPSEEYGEFYAGWA